MCDFCTLQLILQKWNRVPMRLYTFGAEYTFVGGEETAPRPTLGRLWVLDSSRLECCLVPPSCVFSSANKKRSLVVDAVVVGFLVDTLLAATLQPPVTQHYQQKSFFSSFLNRKTSVAECFFANHVEIFC